MDEDIKSFEKEFISARDAYASKILDSITDEETFWKYYHKLHNVLPVGRWVSDCPEFIYLWTDDSDCYHRCEVVHFDDVIELISEYRDDEVYQEEYLTERQREIIKNNSDWDLMKIVLEYTREHQTCGFTFDW